MGAGIFSEKKGFFNSMEPSGDSRESNDSRESGHLSHGLLQALEEPASVRRTVSVSSLERPGRALRHAPSLAYCKGQLPWGLDFRCPNRISRLPRFEVAERQRNRNQNRLQIREPLNAPFLHGLFSRGSSRGKTAH